MIIVAGALFVDPHGREEYLRGCEEVVAKAREAPGCLDYALSPDLVDAARINVYERWTGNEQLSRFRGSGPAGEQLAALKKIGVSEYEVAPEG
jgi:quinol monooxygenase YgiN